jgi:transcriptional regulator with XRE-family HTH domain
MTRTDDESLYLSGVGKLIRAHRSGAGLTQGDLAGAIGCSRASIANMETGRQNVDAFTLAQIAKACGVAVADLHPPGAQLRAPGAAELNEALAAAARLGAALAQFQNAVDALRPPETLGN